jgi:uncharacterized integral membrane protein
MRFVKLIVTVVILGLIAAFIYQNLSTFSAEQTFELSLYFGQPMKWSHSIYSLLGISAVIGFLVGIMVMLKPFLSARKKLAGERQEKPEVTTPKE